MNLTINEAVLHALLHGTMVEDRADVNNAVAHDAARQVVASNHFAIISPSRDTVGHVATLHSPTASEEAKTSARAALLRTAHVARHLGILTPHETEKGGEGDYHQHYLSVAHGSMVETLRGHPHVRAVGGYREAGTAGHPLNIPTESSFVLHGRHGGVTLSRTHAVALGHKYGQDSVIYSGPETHGQPHLLGLHYNDDGSPKHGSFESWQAFDDSRVRAVTPGSAAHHVAAGRTIAFTHAFDPAKDPQRHAVPAPTLDQVAFRLVGRNAGASPADVRH